MNHNELETFIGQFRDEIEQRLPRFLESIDCPDTLKKAMVYSIQAGGKRVRPLLTLAAVKAYRDVKEIDYTVACAVEMVHTYSLIHDDLPAMDDDDYRRGKLTNHKVFGEALAILAGDALLTHAFAMISSLPGVDDRTKITLTQELAHAAGPQGMVGGQTADIEGERRDLSLQELEYIHHHKTGDLLGFAVAAGAILAGSSPEDMKHIRAYAKELGLVFQIKDDILDVEGDSLEMGKSTGSDENKGKVTYPRLLTMAGAKEKLMVHADNAKEHLRALSGTPLILEDFVHYMTERTK
ncbi:geranylgeranyl diphosphate synthase, type II [Alteribacillus persepolensis]|uniref:Farnesyl diphosphate synthase n=1 Tax=Alteribacillus persepolensis TaxID=568899 RepID=A0A1G8D0R3_9BACI|nr:farnesyl diphosphate synthase [Alteribacillus persepolensis]SDH51345.1 geranylgeranyl diphosphate synthase, type II [Alteribacillus persepolensis]